MTARASFTTPVLDIGDDQVVKRYRSSDRGEHLREWQALTLLAGYAPDLAPAPLSADLTSVPPYVRMSRVAGRPLDGQPVTAGHLDAVAAAIGRLHAAVPRDVVAGLRPQPWLAAGVATRPVRAHQGGARAGPVLPPGLRVLLAAQDPRPARRPPRHAAPPGRPATRGPR
jgi:hypothetical protein